MNYTDINPSSDFRLSDFTEAQLFEAASALQWKISDITTHLISLNNHPGFEDEILIWNQRVESLQKVASHFIHAAAVKSLKEKVKSN